MLRYHRTFETFDGVAGSEDRLPESVVFPETLREDFVDQVIGTVFVHFYFFEDYAAFASDVAGVKDGIEHQVAEDIERDGDVLIENLDVEADAFFGGECV